MAAGATGQADGASDEVGLSAGLAGGEGSTVDAGGHALEAGSRAEVVVGLAGGAGVAATHREGAGQTPARTGTAGVAGRHEVSLGAGGAEGGAAADVAAVGAAHAHPRHHIGIWLALQAEKVLVAELTVLGTLETQASSGGEDVASCAFGAEILVAAFQAPKGTQYAVA